MSCRDEILNCVRDIIRHTGVREFTIPDIVESMKHRGSRYSESTIRTHITSRMCYDAPNNHAVTYPDLERIGRGIYRLRGEGNAYGYRTEAKTILRKQSRVKSKKSAVDRRRVDLNLNLGEMTWDDFVPVPLEFAGGTFMNVFGDKNNKTVSETLDHRRYKKLKEPTVAGYSEYLEWPLGRFMIHLKHNGDNYFKSFLNKYGDSIYSKFLIPYGDCLDKKGVYVFKAGGQIKYIGRCRDSMKKRINQGYGKINPKNCYIDGQATNCHLNSLITECEDEVSLWLRVMEDKEAICREEAEMIELHKPPWNIALATSKK